MVKTIKEQLYNKVEEIKKQFLKETGVVLIAYPDIAIEELTLKELEDKVQEHTGQDLFNKSRKPIVVEARRIFTIVADKMGHSKRKIGEYLKGDRNNIYNHISEHNKAMLTDKEYRDRYNTFINKLHEAERQQ